MLNPLHDVGDTASLHRVSLGNLPQRITLANHDRLSTDAFKRTLARLGNHNVSDERCSDQRHENQNKRDEAANTNARINLSTLCTA